MLGSRAASLLSVAISHLFQTEFNADKKLLAFTDSVQDASHRAGFFGARTYRFSLRTAMQSAIEATDDLRLSDLGSAVWEHWLSSLAPEALAPALIPSDLVELALQDAHVAPEEIEYINAHGSSTPLNDSTETLAIKHVFGDHAFKVTISGTKGYYGHALGASGAIEAATCALGMERGWLPPTVNLETPDPDCDLHYLADGGLDGRPRRVVSNSFGFGGVNAALVFGAA